MTQSAKSVVFFGIYMLTEGLVLIFAPNVLLSLFGIEATHEIWIRVAGFILSVLGYYYIRLGNANVVSFFKWSYQVRILQVLFFVGLVLFQSAPPILIGLAMVETASGIWTWWALKHEQA